MKKLLFLLLCVLLVSCSEDTTADGIFIRVKNASQFNFNDVIVSTQEYGDVNMNEVSEYKIFEFAYRYAYVSVQIDGQPYIIQPIDFVGETPLKKGYYTYELKANDSTNPYNKLTLNFIQD